MKDIFLISYQVKGIKSLDKMVSLSFYKKTISVPINTQKYNIKGIYGMNGSGKSGIVASVDILKNLLIYEDYLNNPMVQENLNALINKKSEELYIGVKFLVGIKPYLLYHYEIVLRKSKSGKFFIGKECISYKYPASKKGEFTTIIEVNDGELIPPSTCSSESKISDLEKIFIEKTKNILSNATIPSLFVNKIMTSNEIDKKDIKNRFGICCLWTFILGKKLHVYMDQSDNHTNYFLMNKLKHFAESKYSMALWLENNSQENQSTIANSDGDHINSWLESALTMNQNGLNVFSIDSDLIRKDDYENYKRTVEKLRDFIRIFKSDLTEIDIDRKEDGELYVCSLNLVYGTYSINAEFESTGIKKLIKLFAYLQEMAHGGIVFIDDLDSNLHDVYLCALLEYLMDYGEGQLCFTTHNVGPMDTLKKHKKSIDFLSIDNQIYPWTTNGNYSPSKLYKNGMIAGSPFNVEAIDFIDVFNSFE